MTVNVKRSQDAASRLFWSLLCAGCFSILALSGCTPIVPGKSADEREPHFVLGENRISAMDYKGAIRAFEEALEVDPHSAAAHFQLGWLYDSKVPDPAAAIYHYEKYLELEPDASNAVVVKQRINACKQKLAEDVLALPSMPAAQQQIEQLMTRIQQLKDENRQLREDLSRWKTYAASLKTAQTDATVTVQRVSFAGQADQPGSVESAKAPAAARPAAAHDDRSARQIIDPDSGWGTHKVLAGETAVRIAQHYGISLKALLAANPGVEPRRMPVGLILNIPPPSSTSSLLVNRR